MDFSQWIFTMDFSKWIFSTSFSALVHAVENLNDTKFKSHEGHTEYVTIEEDKDGKYKEKSSAGYGMSKRRDRTPPRRRTRSPQRSSKYTRGH